MFRAGRLVEEGTLYRGPFDGGYISFYVMLNLVLTLFCQGVKVRRRHLETHEKGKAKLIQSKVIPVNEKTFRLAKYFCSVHMEKRYPAYRVKFPAVT